MESRAPVQVVAGVLTDARGRILLARRTAGRDLAGAWEFPGGKVEAGETPFQALDRELHEELGVRIHAASPLIRVAHAYCDKRIVLDVYTVGRFSGKPHGREKQALAWSPSDKLHTYPMPSADRPVVAALTQPDRYLITPAGFNSTEEFMQQLEHALLDGVRRVQLRVKTIAGADLLALATDVKRLCLQSSAELLVNGDVELAQRLQCGVHLTSAQLMALSDRPLPMDLPVAASCHDEVELRRAETLDLDFCVLGPVRATPSHPNDHAMGWNGFEKLRECVGLPIYALGGMRPGDHEVARRRGAQGIAGIRGLWGGAEVGSG